MHKIIRLSALLTAFSIAILSGNVIAASNTKNVVLGKPVEAHDSAFFVDGGNFWSQYAPARAVDGDAGNVKSRWNSSSLSTKGPQTLEINLEGSYQIESCKITLTSVINGFSIQYWDGEWTDIPGGIVSDTMAAGKKHFDIKFIKPVVTEKVRFYYPHDTGVSMTEFEVYGTNASSDMLSNGKEFSDIDDEQLKKAVKLLSCLRIVEGVGNGKYYPEGNVTRAQFVEAVVKALGKDELALRYKESLEYQDVKINSKYYGYIGIARAMGIISSDTNFRPDDFILAEEAICIAVRALGYEFVSQDGGGYAQGYMSIASEIDLTSQGAFAIGKDITRADMAYLIFNMLECKPLTISEILGNSATYEVDSENLLEAIYSIHRSVGNVQGIGDLSLSGTNAPGKDNIVIDAKVLSYDNNDRDILGQRVEYYWQESDMGDRAVMLELVDKKSVLKIKSEDISSQTDEKTLYYYEGSKTRYKKISLMANVYVDGVSKFNYSKTDLQPEDGIVILVDSDSDGEYDVVQVRNYSYIVVSNVNTSDDSVNGVYNDTFSYGNIDYSLKMDNKYIGFEALESNAVLRIEKTDADYYNIEVSAEIVEGTVSGMRADENHTYIIINDMEYKVSGYYLDKQANGVTLKKLDIGSSGIFYLSDSGDIVAFKNGNTDFQYGFLRKAYEEDGKTGKGYFEIIDNNNTRVTYESDRKIVTNAIRGKTKAIAGEVATALTSKPQLVKYKLNSEGELITLYTAAEITGSEDNIDELPFISYSRTGSGGGQLYLPSGNYLSTQYVYTDETVYYYVGLEEPDLGFSYGNIDRDEIKCGPLDLQGLRPYRMILYDFNPDGDHRIKAAVIFSNWIIKYSENRFKTIDGKLDTNAAIFLSNSEKMLDENGEISYKIRCLHKGEEVSFTVKNAEVIDDAAVTLEKGDVFFPETVDGLLSNFWPMYDFSERAYDNTTFTDPAFITDYLNNFNFRNGWYKTFGVIKNYADNVITLDYGSKGFPYRLPAVTRVYIWQNNDVEVGTIADMSVGDYIVLNCNGSTSADILIIRGE